MTRHPVLSSTSLEAAPARLLLRGKAGAGLLPLASSIASAWPAPLVVYAETLGHEELPPRLQTLIRGHRDGAADQAVEQVIRDGFRGAQVPLRPVSAAPRPWGQTPVRMIGMGADGTLPSSKLRADFLAEDGASLVITGPQGERPSHFDEVLCLAWVDTAGPQMAVLRRLAEGLEQQAPTSRRRITNRPDLNSTLANVRPTTLLVLPAGGPPDLPQGLDERSCGVLAHLAAGPRVLVL